MVPILTILGGNIAKKIEQHPSREGWNCFWHFSVILSDQVYPYYSTTMVEYIEEQKNSFFFKTLAY